MAFSNIIETIQKPEIDRLVKIDLINHSRYITNSGAPFISGDDALFLPEEEVNRLYPFAEDLLFAYFLRDTPHIFPPNPLVGRKILKENAVMQWDGNNWEVFRSLAPEQTPADAMLPEKEPADLSQPHDASESLQQTSL